MLSLQNNELVLKPRPNEIVLRKKRKKATDTKQLALAVPEGEQPVSGEAAAASEANLPQPEVQVEEPVDESALVKLPLLFGFTCPVCQNIIMAAFTTEKEIDIAFWEETRLLWTSGESKGQLRRVMYATGDKLGPSCYRSEFDPRTNVQTIVLKNHMVPRTGILNRKHDNSHLEEPGPTACRWKGVFSLSERIMVSDFLHLSQLDVSRIEGSVIPPLDHFVPRTESTVNPEDPKFLRIAARGEMQVPDMVLIQDYKIEAGFDFQVAPLLQSFQPQPTTGVKP